MLFHTFKFPPLSDLWVNLNWRCHTLSLRFSLCVCVFPAPFCPWQMFRGYLLPTAHCLVCKSGARPLGRSREGTKNLVRPTWPPAEPPSGACCPHSAHLGWNKSAGPSVGPGAFLTTDPLLTPQRPGTELTACSSETISNLSPSTARKLCSLRKSLWKEQVGSKNHLKLHLIGGGESNKTCNSKVLLCFLIHTDDRNTSPKKINSRPVQVYCITNTLYLSSC